MLTLSDTGISTPHEWEALGFKLPAYRRETLRQTAQRAPVWLHFGAGNIFRAYPAVSQQRLLNAGLSDTGIIVCEGYDDEILDLAYTPYDNLCIAATLKESGLECEVVGSVVESLKISDYQRLREIFVSPSLAMVTFTITEKGYQTAGLAPDIQSGVKKPSTFIGVLTALCYERYQAGELPIALVSMDNCSQNGDKLKTAVLRVAEGWRDGGYVPAGFVEYLTDSGSVSFPCTMIDKITPRPSEAVLKKLNEMGCGGLDIAFTKKRTCVSGFVNAEETEYLVIEDAFPNGRPPLEKAGVIFTDRATVEKAERMKVGACLNPLHTILGVFGRLLGYDYIHETTRDPALLTLIKRAGYDEAMPYVEDPVIIEPSAFIKEVLEIRFPNPYIMDTPKRIAVDTSQAIPPRFGETLKRMKLLGHDSSKLVCFPFFFAGWLRYLMGVGDDGIPMELSPDPMLEELTGYMSAVSLGDTGPFTDIIKPILSNQEIFGVNLFYNGLAAAVEEYFSQMVAGAGAVRQTLDRYFA
ncbi:MAG: mannitol dehydrogenase family protein [Clostridiales bacterium]|jgi:fructuronate reductase|nr:mannitol dehydrogenase family protein [Clostridiales bacterium]